MQERVIIVIVATAIGLFTFGDAIDPRQTGPRRELTKGFAVDLDAANKSGGALISDRENNDFAVDRENIHDIKTVHVPASSGSVESVTETGGRTSDFVELVRRSAIGEQSVTCTCTCPTCPATEEPPSSSPEQACKSGWSVHNSSCYLYVATKLDWSSSKAACLAMSANLASIPDMGTNDFITKLASSTNYSWIGGFQASGSAPWEWSDQSTWGFENWKTGEPNGSNENCVEMYIHVWGVWNDKSCSNPSSYVCEKPWTA